MSIDAMKQALEYTRPGAIVPVTPETVKILVDALRLVIEQAERQPLTDEEIVACIDDVFAWALDDGNIDDSHVIRFTRAIERAHGIGGKHD
jgi:hypothetical protein